MTHAHDTTGDDWRLVWSTCRRASWLRALTAGPNLGGDGLSIALEAFARAPLREYLFGGAIEVGAAGTRVRAGRRVVVSALLDRAWLDAEGGDRAQGLAMVVESTRVRFGFRIRLHGDLEPLLDDVDSRLLQAMIANSGIAMPTSDDDPLGTHAKRRFPSNLTRAEALALVTSPPGPDDPLPAAW